MGFSQIALVPILAWMAGSRRRLWCERECLGDLGAVGFTPSCLASETRFASQRYGKAPLSIRCGAASNFYGRGRLELVTVEPEGWALKGFRYRVVLGPTLRGAASSCELTPRKAGCWSSLATSTASVTTLI